MARSVLDKTASRALNSEKFLISNGTHINVSQKSQYSTRLPIILSLQVPFVSALIEVHLVRLKGAKS